MMLTSGTHDGRRGSWDFGLILATVTLLAGLGVQSLAGTLYAWWAYRNVPGWEVTGHGAFVEVMNAIAAPMVAGLVLAMGLCVPKRLFERRALVVVCGVMLAAGAAVGVAASSVSAGLMTYLCVSALVQAAVVTRAVTGRLRGQVSGGGLGKAGSGLLHLGFIGFAIVVVGLQDSSGMLPAFWLATGLIVIGSALSFHARPQASASDPGE